MPLLQNYIYLINANSTAVHKEMDSICRKLIAYFSLVTWIYTWQYPNVSPSTVLVDINLNGLIPLDLQIRVDIHTIESNFNNFYVSSPTEWIMQMNILYLTLSCVCVFTRVRGIYWGNFTVILYSIHSTLLIYGKYYGNLNKHCTIKTELCH